MPQCVMDFMGHCAGAGLLHGKPIPCECAVCFATSPPRAEITGTWHVPTKLANPSVWLPGGMGSQLGYASVEHQELVAFLRQGLIDSALVGGAGCSENTPTSIKEEDTFGVKALCNNKISEGAI
eukprot:1160067-Pelagomonas_calceolata.AAC.4